MDVHLLDKALNCYGSSLLHQLEAEHGDAAVIPVALRRKYSGIATVNKDFWSSEDKENGEFKAAVEKFIAKKADLLFESKHHRSVTKDVLEENPEDVYGILAPLESFMHVPPDLCHQHFYESLSVDDVVIGVVVSVMETGLVARLLCVDSPSMDRDIDELDITAFCPSKELPRMFTHQSVTEAYQPRDIVRGIVLSINPEKEKIILSLRDKSDVAEKEILPKIGLISKDDFPVHYRRKLQKNEMSFNQLLHSILGFTNKGSVDFLRSSLGLSNTSSLMRGLHRLKIPEEEYADKLRKWQAQKQARWSVEQGVEMVKKGRQLEAIQYLNRALQLDPDNTEALVARGAVYANNECYPKAVEDFERALEADPKHSNARKYLLETRLAFGRSHEERDQLEEAEDDYKEALKLNPQSSEARDGLERVKHLQAKDKSKKGKHSPVIVISTSGSSDEDDKLQRATETLKRLIHADDKDNRKAKTKVGSRSRSRKKSRKHSRRKSRHKKSYMSSSSSSETDSSSSPNSEIQKKQKQHYTRCPVDDSPDSLESEQERKSNSRGKDRQLTSGPLHREKIQIEGKHLTSRPQKQQSRVKEKELSSDSSLSDAS
ncbi:hypothetical protein C0Q70_21293 [Pomacea canaliculata]|uniref:S1 motif domain-containing protein n=1 Tax=Pomacea canaliculata TaxID=400727 RepID=A0A2T7NC78_POMCA|nr:tetratricopeptide repeat protein 14-like [Pomacea canaliculata]PVD18742.1 hypothetical protein C0Q70_21293 [Pomacea canaliculata]